MTTAAARRREPAATAPDDRSRCLPRIALFSGNFNYVRDGANRALNQLVGDLQKRGATVRVYSPTNATPAFAPAGPLVSIPSVRFPGRGEYRVGLGVPRAIRADLRRFAPDLIHVSAPDWTGVVAQKLARTMRVPLVASLHTRFETYADFYGASLIRPAMERHLHRFYARADCILVPTLPILEEFGRAGHASPVRLWSRGVDRTQFDPARRDPSWRREAGIGEDTCAVLFFGRLVREKGLADFVAVIDRLAARNVAVHAMVVGDGPERGWLERRLPSAVVLGHLDGAELGRAVASADVLLNPSTTEAFGNVTLEAMASGLPTVSVDVPSARTLLADDAGVFYARGDLDGAAEAVARLATFAERRQTVGRRARARSADYGWSRASDMVWDAYEALLGDACEKAA